MRNHDPSLDLPPARPRGAHEPADRRPSHLEALDDMEAIFGRPSPAVGSPTRGNVIPMTSRHRSRRAAMMPVLLAVAVFGVGFAVRSPVSSETPVRTVAATREPAVAPRIERVTPVAAGVGAIPAPVVQAEIRRGPLVEPVGSVAVPDESISPPPAAVLTRAPQPPARAAPVPVAVASAPAPAASADTGRFDPLPSPDPCAGDVGERRWCVEAALFAADRRLRSAYGAAAAAGVKPAALRHYRREWDRVRWRNQGDPAATIANYRGMARDLRELAGEPDDSGGGR